MGEVVSIAFGRSAPAVPMPGTGAGADIVAGGRAYAHVTNHYADEIFIGDTRTRRPLALPGHNRPKEGVTYPLLISYAAGTPHHHFNAAVMAAFDPQRKTFFAHGTRDCGVGIYTDLSVQSVPAFRR